MGVAFAHFFSKNICEFDIVLTRTVNILTTISLGPVVQSIVSLTSSLVTNELVKLTML